MHTTCLHKIFHTNSVHNECNWYTFSCHESIFRENFFFKSFMTTCTYMFLLSRFSGKLCVGKMNCIYLKILHKTLYLSFFVVLLLCKLFSMIFRSFSTEFIFYITCSQQLNQPEHNSADKVPCGGTCPPRFESSLVFARFIQ